MIKISSRLLLIITIIIINACGKTSDIIPSQNLFGIQECITKEFLVTDDYGDIVYFHPYTYVYNDENKVVEYSITEYINYKSVPKKITFQEFKESLGSKSKPYIVELKDNNLNAKYYCDNNGRVSRKENFSSGSILMPISIENEEYDSYGNHIKSTTRQLNIHDGSLTEEFSILEGEYIGGNLSKLYSTYSYSFGIVERHLFREYKSGSIVNKNIISFLFNYGVNDFGEGNKNHPDKRTTYHADGTIYRQGTFSYKFDNKGYLLSSEIINLDATKSTYSGFIYQCKF